MEKTPFPTTLDELETYPQQTLTAEQVAQFLGCSVQSIRSQAQIDAGALGFPVILYGSTIAATSKEDIMTTTIIPARERAQAPIGLPYIAPLMAHAWFRCDITAGSGIYKLGRDVAGLKSVPIQIFANGEWHTVVGWDTDKCFPAWQRGLELNEEEDA